MPPSNKNGNSTVAPIASSAQLPGKPAFAYSEQATFDSPPVYGSAVENFSIGICLGILVLKNAGPKAKITAE